MIKISTRLVFIFKNFVIKIPIDKRGYLQGKNEKVIWNKYKGTNLLGVFYWECLGIVCMKKYNVCKTDIPIKVVINLKSNIKEFDLINCDLYNYENWAFDNAKYILIDYGINERISKMYSHLC